MPAMNYKPIGSKGYTCELTTKSGRQLRTERPDPDAADVITGDPDLHRNESLVSSLNGHAQQEYQARRTRNDDFRESHQAAAADFEKTCVELAELIVDVGMEGRDDWCSGCFEWTTHRRVNGVPRPLAHICSGCGACTTECAAPRCVHFAIRSTRRRTIPSYCAEHRHEIPSFEKLDRRLDSLEDYADWLAFDAKNAKRVTTLGLGLAGGSALVVPLAFVAAPAIGGMIGSWAGLSGAAASSHGLALLGGGAVAAGGAGMAGGTAVVTAAGATLGGALGTAVTSAYASADDSFKIELIQPGEGPPVVFAKGFLTDGEIDNRDWVLTIRDRYPDAPIYRVHWGAKELKALAVLGGRGLSEQAIRKTAVRLAAQATKAGSKKLGILGGLLTARSLAANPWTVAHNRAAMTGAMLADIMARTEEPKFVLVGHSLGARVMVTAAQALGVDPTKETKIETMHLFGAAVEAKQDWRTLDAAVSGSTYNYWSTNDKVLKVMYRVGQVGDTAAGHVGIGSKYRSIKDRNVSRSVQSHSDYVSQVKLQ